MDADLLLRWLSIRGTGSLSKGVRKIASLMDGTIDNKRKVAYSYLRRLEALGHVDLFWAEDEWQIRPATLTHLPGSSALALLIGRRNGKIQSRLENDMWAHHVKPVIEKSSAVDSDPVTLLFEYDSEADLRCAAKDAGVTFIPCAAVELAEGLLPICPGPRSAGPNNFGSTLQMFIPAQGVFKDVETAHKDGLFRQSINGRYQYWLFKAGDWLKSSYAEGVCLIQANNNAKCFQHQLDERHHDTTGRLLVNTILPLPAQQRRALTLCSGITPTILKKGVLTYHNVPLSVSHAVANSLHQDLELI